MTFDYRHVGLGLMVIGLALIVWVLKSIDEVPNYLRVAALLPIFVGQVVANLGTFRYWDDRSDAERIRAGASVILAVMTAAAAVVWFITAPGARA